MRAFYAETPAPRGGRGSSAVGDTARKAAQAAIDLARERRQRPREVTVFFADVDVSPNGALCAAMVDAMFAPNARLWKAAVGKIDTLPDVPAATLPDYPTPP